MTERNLCAENGCPAACCRNIHGHVAGRAEYFLKAFPNAQKVESVRELTEKIKSQELGAYFFEERGWTYFAISGDCPNLLPDFSCKIHEEKFYPKPCVNMRFNGDSCASSQDLYVSNLAVIR